MRLTAALTKVTTSGVTESLDPKSEACPTMLKRTAGAPSARIVVYCHQCTDKERGGSAPTVKATEGGRGSRPTDLQ